MNLNGVIRLCFSAVIVIAFLPFDADAQVFVYPRRPHQSNVRYFDFQWQHIDILVGEDADPDDIERTIHTPQQPHSLHDNNHYSRPDAMLSWQGQNRRELRSQNKAVEDGPGQLQNLSLAQKAKEQESLHTRMAEPRERLDVTESFVDSIRVSNQGRSIMDAPDPKAGGVRLYFYERERDVAERAAAFIADSYAYLIQQFNYVPQKTLPYVLYNSYQEFLQTNLFPIQEGVLGVTSVRDLTLVLPYFGDHRRFQHVSAHEMVHQFTIQKVRDVAREAELSSNPLERIPLWFIEGIAEYYAHRGLDSETEMLARDLLLNPDPQRGYVMLDFFEDRPFSGLWTYKIGQIRAAFLEENYGEGTLQLVLEHSKRLVAGTADDRPALSFRGLLTTITGDDGRTISVKFESWLKRRAYSTYLKAQQDSPDVAPLGDFRGVVQTLTTAPDGYLMMYRAIDSSTGQAQLYLVDARRPDIQRKVSGDGVPGVESLHPIAGRNFDVHENAIVFSARSKGRDIIYLQQVTRKVGENASTNGQFKRWQVDLSLGDRQGYALNTHGILAVEAPTFSPDGRQIAFIGLDEDGQKDIFILERLEGKDFVLSRLTNDIFAERGLTWGHQGLIYTSDATGHGYYNLFRVNPENGDSIERLTYERNDQFDPHILDNGRILFSAYENGRANVYEYTESGLLRHTDIVTGLFNISSGPGPYIWASFHHRGERHPVRMSMHQFLATPVETALDDDPVVDLASHSLEDSSAYSASSIRNWQVSNIFGILGASGSGIYGQLVLLTNDRLRNHAMLLNIMAFGSLERTDANLFYINQEKRLIWGAGAFQNVLFRIDRTLDDEDAFLTGERFYGGRGTLRYPLNRFFYIQGDLSIGGVSYFLPEGSENFLQTQNDENPDGTMDHIDNWRAVYERARFQTSPSMSLGYNTIRLHPGTGPLNGTSWLLETTLDFQPFESEVHGQVRLDAERYFSIYGRTNFSIRTGTGTTFGGQLARQFYLSSFDTLRGVQFGDPDFLLGHHFHYTKLELRFPLNFIVRVPVLDIEGVLGSDIGAVGADINDMWNRRVLGLVTGFNFGLGPLVFRLHFARPVDIGAFRVPAQGDWITNFSLGWRYW